MTRDATPIAKGPVDVIRTTVSSFCTVGLFGFSLTAVQEFSARSGVSGRARDRVPYFVVQASLRQAQRWGRVSAGFAGGRALGQAIRGVDDGTCALMGSIFGGIAAAPTVSAMPSSVATFAAFGYFIESFTAGSKPESVVQRRATLKAQRAKLQRQLEACERQIEQLPQPA